MEHGHPEARDYPIGRVIDECDLVVERINGLQATNAFVAQMAVSAGMGSKKAAKELQRLIKEWTKNGK